MSQIAAHRWLMTAPGAPLERADFTAAPGAGDVVVAVAGCGVCHTDLGYYYDGVRTNAPLPLALGHEISGHVVAAEVGTPWRAAYSAMGDTTNTAARICANRSGSTVSRREMQYHGVSASPAAMTCRQNAST